MVDTKNQYLAIKEEVDAAIQDVLDSAAYINGKAVKDFTQNLSTYLGVDHVIPCANRESQTYPTHPNKPKRTTA